MAPVYLTFLPYIIEQCGRSFLLGNFDCISFNMILEVDSDGGWYIGGEKLEAYVAIGIPGELIPTTTGSRLNAPLKEKSRVISI